MSRFLYPQKFYVKSSYNELHAIWKKCLIEHGKEAADCLIDNIIARVTWCNSDSWKWNKGLIRNVYSINIIDEPYKIQMMIFLKRGRKRQWNKSSSIYGIEITPSGRATPDEYYVLKAFQPHEITDIENASVFERINEKNEGMTSPLAGIRYRFYFDEEWIYLTPQSFRKRFIKFALDILFGLILYSIFGWVIYKFLLKLKLL